MTNAGGGQGSFTSPATRQLRAMGRLRSMFGAGRKDERIPTSAATTPATSTTLPVPPAASAGVDEGVAAASQHDITDNNNLGPHRNVAAAASAAAAAVLVEIADENKQTARQRVEEGQEWRQELVQLHPHSPSHLAGAAEIERVNQARREHAKEEIETSNQHYVYVPTHASSDFLRTATPRHMQRANDVL